MGISCPEVEELEYYLSQSVSGEEIDPAIKEHLQHCYNCKFLIKRLKEEIVSKVLNQKPKLEGYDILELIGTGSVSKVYLAKHKNLGKLHAVKVIEPQEQESEGSRILFERRAQLLSQIDHKNIVRFIDTKIDGAGIRYVIMQYVNGKSLAEIIPLPLEKCYHYMKQMVAGLQVLHEKDLLLEDVKPSTFQVDEKEEVRIIDFGLANSLNPHDAENDTSIGSYYQHYYYKSPEECQGQPVSVASDIYSLGATFYTMIHGEPAFSGYDFLETLNLILNTSPTSLRESHPEVPHLLDEMILQMMSKNPEERIFLGKAFSILELIHKSKLTKSVEVPKAEMFETLKVEPGTFLDHDLEEATAVVKNCEKCGIIQLELVCCAECQKLVCHAHMKGNLCEDCLSEQKEAFIGKETLNVFSYLKKHMRRKIKLAVKGECNATNIRDITESLRYDPVGGFLILKLKNKQFGLMIQPNSLRLFLYGRRPFRNLSEILADSEKLDLERFEPSLFAHNLDEQELEQYLKPEEKVTAYDLGKLISQELVCFLLSNETKVKYIAGKVPEDKLATIEPVFVHQGLVKSYPRWLEHFGRCLEALTFPGMIILDTSFGRKVGIHLEERRVKMLFYGIKEEHSTFWEDHLVGSQLSFLEAIEQDKFICDGEYCVRSKSSGQGTAVQRARKTIAGELQWFFEQKEVQFSYLKNAPSNAIQSGIKTVELVGDYRALILSLLTKVNETPNRIDNESLLNIIAQADSSKHAVVHLFQQMNFEEKLKNYRKDLGYFEATLLCLLEIKLLSGLLLKGMEQIQKTLLLLNHQKVRQGILEMASLIFPQHEEFQNELSIMYQESSNIQYL